MKLKNFYSILLVVFSFFPCLRVQADDAPYQHVKVISGSDSQPLVIRHAGRDESGNIWFISGGAVHQYNGVTTTLLSQLYQAPLPFDEAEHIACDHWGRLWIGTRSGLRIFDLKTWEFVPHDHPLGKLTKHLVNVVYCGKESIYLSLQHQGVFRITASGAEKIIDTGHESELLRWRITADDDYVWVTNGDNVYSCHLASGRQQKAALPSSMFRRTEGLLPVKNGVLFRLFGEGFWMYDGRHFRPVLDDVLDKRDFSGRYHLSFADGAKLAVYHGLHYFEFSRDTSLRLIMQGTHDLEDHIFKKRINATHYVQQEWLISTDEGLYSLFPYRFRFNYLQSGSARGGCRLGDVYYLGGYGYLQQWERGKPVRPLRSSPEDNYYGFARVSEDTVCIATEGSFLKFLVNGRVIPAPEASPRSVKDYRRWVAFCVDASVKDTLLVGTSDGIWQYCRPSGKVIPLTDKEGKFYTAGQKILSVARDGPGITFSSDVGFFKAGSNGAMKVYPSPGENLTVYDHFQDGNRYFLATNGRGLVIIDGLSNEVQSVLTDNGLASNTVYSIVKAGEALFLGTHNGLSVWENGVVSSYHAADGLPFEEFNHQARWYDEKGDLVFMGGTGGYVYFSPKELLGVSKVSVPQPALSGIRIGYKRNVYTYDYRRASDTIALSADAVWLSAQFARPDHYRLAYRTMVKVSPLMDEYQEMSASHQLNLAGLRAGTYAVSVKHIPYRYGVGEMSHTWTLVKKPAFTETAYFYMLLILGSIGLICMFFYSRISRIRAEAQIRTRISRDLHDEVGGLLTSISMHADMLRVESSDKEHAENISRSSKDAILTMDDIIWSNDARNNLCENLSDRMKYLASQLLEPAGIPFTLDLYESEQYELSQSLRQNIYLIYKEALHNICKHADDSQHVSVWFEASRKQIELSVINYSGSQLRRIPVRAGSGLNNMEQRAQQIHARLHCGYTDDGYQVYLLVKRKNHLFGWEI